MIESLKKQKWVVGVSGGSDSMALLHMCLMHKVDVYVAHVNYQKRDSANRDMEGVKAFCKKHDIPCFVLCVDEYKEKENFQKQARDIRYRFYKEIVEQYGCEGVLVAHHKDDVIETYLMQKKANRIPVYYGIKEDTVLFGIHVKRVLLQYTKKELELYCKKHGITYFEDESNFSDLYERNRIRHEKVDLMSDAKKDAIIEEICMLNRTLALEEEQVRLYLEGKERLEVESFLSLEEHLQYKVLRAFIVQYTNLREIRKSALKDMIHMVKNHKKTNVNHTINDLYDIRVEYGFISIDKKEEKDLYSYVMHSIEYMDTPYFKICDQGKVIEGVSVKEEDFPLCIRNARNTDEIKLRFGTKKVRRFFIDRKIAQKDRKVWPVVENKEGIVIFVSGIGCDINHYSNNSSFFVIK